MKEKLDVCMASCVEGEGGRVRLTGLQGASPFLLNFLSSAHIFINSQVINPWITPCVCSLFPIGTDAEMWSLYSGAKSNLRDGASGEVEKDRDAHSDLPCGPPQKDLTRGRNGKDLARERLAPPRTVWAQGPAKGSPRLDRAGR